MSPSIAIVICLHRPGDGLENVLERLARTRGAAQIVVALDGVEPAVAAKVEVWAARTRHVSVVDLPESRGVAAARNLALRSVLADYVWFVDDDDEWRHDALEVLRLELWSRPDILQFRAAYRWGAVGEERPADGWDHRISLTRAEAGVALLQGRMHGFLWSKLFRAEVLGKDPFPALSSQSDVVGVARAVARAHRIHTVPDVMYTYVRRPGSITRHDGQRVRNLMEAGGLVVAALSGAGSDVIGREDAFLAWFVCQGAVRTLVRQSVRDAASVLRTSGVTRAAEGLSLVRAARYAPAAAATVVVLRVSPAAALAATALAYRLLDVARRGRHVIRVRRRRPGPLAAE